MPRETVQHFASATQRNRHGLPAGIYAEGALSPRPENSNRPCADFFIFRLYEDTEKF